MKEQNPISGVSTAFGNLHFRQYGNGSQVFLVFHGFGQDHSMATPLAEVLQNQYTFYSFDLPYHGKSKWSEDENVITKIKLKESFSIWLQENEINRFSILGYSMGGKFAISVAEQFPNETDRLILVAPDGLYKSLWYNLAISWPIKSIFRRIIDKPKLFFQLTKLINATGLVPKKLLQFGESQMATRQLRMMVYYTWHNFKRLYIDQEVLKTAIDKHNLRATLILGKNDQVISPNKIIPNIDAVGFDIQILDAGHAKVMELAAEFIKDNF